MTPFGHSRGVKIVGHSSGKGLITLAVEFVVGVVVAIRFQPISVQ